MLHVLALSVLAVVLRHPELMTYERGVQLPSDNLSPVPTPLVELELRERGQVLLTSGDIRDGPPPEFRGDIAEKPIIIHSNSFATRAIYYRK